MPPASSTDGHRPRVLIADDNEPNRELLEAYLDDLDCEIATAVDGADTLTQVAAFSPDVILLDVMMPKLSGFEVCQRLKGDPKTSPIMILMVTALGELGDIERAVEAGTDDFLSKPVNRVELVKRVENMLKLRHVSDELQRLRSYISTMDDDQPPRRAEAKAERTEPEQTEGLPVSSSGLWKQAKPGWRSAADTQ
jgi:two-component system alkaline phosphatase synthesis response regulator PhoP